MEISLENWCLNIKHLTFRSKTRSSEPRPGIYHGQHDLISLGRPWLPIRCWSFSATFWLVLVLRSRCRIVTQRSFPSFLGRSVTRQKQLRGRLGVLTIYIGKPEIPIGKSNALHHFVWKFQEIKAVIWSEVIFLLFWVCLADLNILWGGRSDNKTFVVLCLWTRFLPG